jgi:hypothetical protein
VLRSGVIRKPVGENYGGRTSGREIATGERSRSDHDANDRVARIEPVAERVAGSVVGERRELPGALERAVRTEEPEDLAASTEKSRSTIPRGLA